MRRVIDLVGKKGRRMSFGAIASKGKGQAWVHEGFMTQETVEVEA